MESIALLGLAGVVATLMIREVWSYLRWKRNLDQIDRGEWTRTIRALRDR
ncbi:MAG: hypothetical protein SGI92_22445 [Bryobacteraceae bacterium]|nr:hypothetical protein [Bryobacteraceae bacterium]